MPLVERAEGVALDVGCQLLGYRLGRVLAEGTLGTVYEGDSLCRKPVVIKVLRREVVHDSLALGAFVKEVYGVNGIGHPGIVGVCSVGLLDDGRCFVVMDRIDGVSLSQVLSGERRTAVEPDLALSLLEQLCQIVGAAHDAGHLHLGLNPRRLLMLRCPPYPTIRVLGFGCACLTDSAVEAREPAAPAYAAPEQQAGRAADRRADVFSIGALFYEMVTGRHPLNPEAESGLRRLAAVGNGMTKVILKALARDPSARYGSTARLLEAAQEVLYGPPPPALEGDAETQITEPPSVAPQKPSVAPQKPHDTSSREDSTHVSPTFPDVELEGPEDDEEPTVAEPALFPASNAWLRPVDSAPIDPAVLGDDPPTELAIDVRPLPHLRSVPSSTVDPNEEETARHAPDTYDDPGAYADDAVEHTEHDSTRPDGTARLFPENRAQAPRPRPTGRIPAGPLEETFVEGADTAGDEEER